MRGAAHAWLETPRRTGDVLEVAAQVQWPLRLSRLGRRRTQRVWIRVPGDLEVGPVAIADAFLLGLVFGTMRLARGIHLHATATRDLVENLGRLPPLWAERRPDKYREIEIRCDGLETGPVPSGPAILCYSGGLDSSYSLFRHTEPGRPPGGRRVGAALMLHGADIPVRESEAFERAFARSRTMVESRGVPLLRATTNLREVKQNWGHSCSATLAGVTGLFRGRHGGALVAVAYTPEEARRWWPQDVTDLPLFSSRAFPVEGDGYEADRFDKLLAIRDWPEAMENLRVCFRPGSWSSNCGECFKCLIVGLFARVALGRTPAFLPRAFTGDDVRAVTATKDPNVGLRLQQLVTHARALGVREPWLVDVERALAGVEAAPAAAGGRRVPPTA